MKTKKARYVVTYMEDGQLHTQVFKTLRKAQALQEKKDGVPVLQLHEYDTEMADSIGFVNAVNAIVRMSHAKFNPTF